jgi:alkanesulfonate monooxygenase SsuD/methylene tetrahydromethanopterin reductase-like flavin-dependent oxidoreductase (luciferase family)
MKFGMMYEIQIPEPHYPGIEQERYKQVMAQVELADEIGYDYFWTVEHHFLKEFSHCPAPEVLYGAISQRTKRIRIGHAVALLPQQYNHPARVAERAAVLDILSGGRMDLGTGRSTTPIEMGAFQVNPDETEAQWREALGMIPRMWTEDPFSHEGHYFQMPPVSVIPKPIQKPHPPMWMACIRPESMYKAGSLGIGALCFAPGGKEQMAEKLTAYREGIKNCEPVGSFINDQVAAVCLTHCAMDDAAAKRVAAEPAAWFINKGAELYRTWHADPSQVSESYQFQLSQQVEKPAEELAKSLMDSGGAAIGNPDTIIEVLKDYQDIGVDQVMFVMEMGGLPHTNIMESIKLVGKHVMPYFR